MRRIDVRSQVLALACIGALLFAQTEARAQAAPATAKSAEAKKGDDAKAAKKEKKPKEPGSTKVARLFESDAPLALTFTTNIRQLRRDKGEKAPWRWASVGYTDSAGKAVEVPVRARTRGIWRLKRCDYPPVRLNFKNEETKGTLLRDLDEPKLVNYCRNSDKYEQYMLQELQLYRVYQLLTPFSHRVRLLKVTYADSGTSKQEAVRYGFIVEDPSQLAKRLEARIIKTKGALPHDLDHPQLALAYLFQYFIGNTDFSFNGLHNTELLSTSNGTIVPTVYDFDFSGAVNAEYATADPRMLIRAVRVRKFLGYCAIAAEYPGALAKLMEQKAAIYALYQDQIGKLMDPKVVKETLSYFDEFYDELKSPNRARDLFGNCVGPS